MGKMSNMYYITFFRIQLFLYGNTFFFFLNCSSITCRGEDSISQSLLVIYYIANRSQLTIELNTDKFSIAIYLITNPIKVLSIAIIL